MTRIMAECEPPGARADLPVSLTRAGPGRRRACQPEWPDHASGTGKAFKFKLARHGLTVGRE